MSELNEKMFTSGSDESAGTLVSLCRGKLVANLERYPAESFAILDEVEWEAVISLRHERTRPQKGSGGLDGTGRMNPAVGDKFMSEVEEMVPHIARSRVVDNLVWKDIVEFKFKAGGLARPKELLYPWPVLEAKIETSKRALVDLVKQEGKNEETKRSCIRAIKFLRSSPMDVSLLSSSGIGKTVSKFLKKAPAGILDQPVVSTSPGETPRTILKETLDSWMAFAANSGVKMKESPASSDRKQQSIKRANLESAKKCRSWRELFSFLKEKDEEQRSSLGARMSQRRKKLDQVRPKIVKVRHASSRQRSILDGRSGMSGTGSSSPSPGSSRMGQLRQEASVTSSRRGLLANSSHNTAGSVAVASRPGAGFGAAVAFASGMPSKKRKIPGSTRVELGGGRRMKIPATKKASENMKRLALLKKGTRPSLR
jgi:hypothetical protein